MSVSFAIYLFFLLPFGQAQKAHVHGAATLNLAMEGTKGELEFETPAEGIIGFEQAPKTPAQKKAVADALAAFRTKANALFVLPPEAKCTLTPKEVDFHREGAQHAEMHAQYAVVCAKEPKGQLVLKALESYPNLREVTVVYVSNAQQKSGKVTKAKMGFGL